MKMIPKNLNVEIKHSKDALGGRKAHGGSTGARLQGFFKYI